MKSRRFTVVALAASMLATAAGASASMMHPLLGARLAGMGDHGVVNLTLTQSSGKVCWTFKLPARLKATRASIHTGQSSAMLFELGMHYTTSGCATESPMTITHLETKPSNYSVWIDTKAHRGDLRGALFAGMAHM